MKTFDIIVTNPPFQKNTKGGTGGRDLWDKFVILAEKLTKQSGYIAIIHPSKWRGPEHYIWGTLSKYYFQRLQIYSAKAGRKIFNVSTRFDWYILKKANKKAKTKVVDEINKKHNIDLNQFPFLPNYNFRALRKILATKDEPKCEVLYSRSLYGNDKKHMSPKQDEQHLYPCVYGMYKDRQKLLYSSKKQGHFGVSKVIVSCGALPYPLIDIEGKYGMCNNCFGLIVESLDEAEKIKSALNSDEFLEIIKSTKWATYQISYKMFRYFKRDFYNYIGGKNE